MMWQGENIFRSVEFFIEIISAYLSSISGSLPMSVHKFMACGNTLRKFDVSKAAHSRCYCIDMRFSSPP